MKEIRIRREDCRLFSPKEYVGGLLYHALADALFALDITCTIDFDKCSEQEIETLSSIGIHKPVVWSRDLKCTNDAKNFIYNDPIEGFWPFYSSGNGGTLAAHSFNNEKEAIKTAKEFNLILQMRSWVKFHCPNFKVDYNAVKNTENWGIVIENTYLQITGTMYFHYFLFQIELPTRELAKSLLKEFRKDIEELYNLKNG